MANNYVKFSEVIADLTPEEEEWARLELLPLDEWCPDGLGADDFNRLMGEFCDKYDIADEETWPDFEWSIIKGKDLGLGLLTKPDAVHLVIYSDGHACVDQASSFIQGFLARHRPGKAFALQWAEYCDKPRPGEFGGGGMVITPEEIKVEHTSHIVSRFLGKNNKLMPTVDQILGEILEFFDKFFEGSGHDDPGCDCDSCLTGAKLREKYSRLITRDSPSVEEEIASTLWNEFANGTYSFGGSHVESVKEDNGKVVLHLQNGKAYIVEARDATDEY